MNKNLKITSIDIYKADIELLEPFKIAIMKIDKANNIFVKINTNEGIYGVGEACPTWRITGETQSISFSGAQDIARLLLGKNPMHIEERIEEMNRFFIHNTSLCSAFDMALYDLFGKLVGLPLYAVLGGEKRSLWTDCTISIDSSDKMTSKAIDYKNQGFRAIKVKLGTTMDQDIQIIQRIREAIGEKLPIRIDANQGWDFNTAVSVLKTIEPMKIEYCEQPVAYWDHENMRRVRQNTSIPIMADESLFNHHDAFKLAAMGCCDYFNIKLAKSGGINNALKINNIAESAGIFCMVGCMLETRLGLTAAAHMVSSRRNIRWLDLDGCFFQKMDPVMGGASFTSSEIILQDIPGHGADIDSAFLKQCQSITI